MLSFDERTKAWNALGRKKQGLLLRNEWMMADEDKMAEMLAYAETAGPNAPIFGSHNWAAHQKGVMKAAGFDDQEIGQIRQQQGIDPLGYVDPAGVPIPRRKPQSSDMSTPLMGAPGGAQDDVVNNAPTGGVMVGTSPEMPSPNAPASISYDGLQGAARRKLQRETVVADPSAIAEHLPGHDFFENVVEYYADAPAWERQELMAVIASTVGGTIPGLGNIVSAAIDAAALARRSAETGQAPAALDLGLLATSLIPVFGNIRKYGKLISLLRKANRARQVQKVEHLTEMAKIVSRQPGKATARYEGVNRLQRMVGGKLDEFEPIDFEYDVTKMRGSIVRGAGSAVAATIIEKVIRYAFGQRIPELDQIIKELAIDAASGAATGASSPLSGGPGAHFIKVLSEMLNVGVAKIASELVLEESRGGYSLTKAYISSIGRLFVGLTIFFADQIMRKLFQKYSVPPNIQSILRPWVNKIIKETAKELERLLQPART